MRKCKWVFPSSCHCLFVYCLCPKRKCFLLVIFTFVHKPTSVYTFHHDGLYKVLITKSWYSNCYFQYNLQQFTSQIINNFEPFRANGNPIKGKTMWCAGTTICNRLLPEYLGAEQYIAFIGLVCDEKSIIWHRISPLSVTYRTTASINLLLVIWIETGFRT